MEQKSEQRAVRLAQTISADYLRWAPYLSSEPKLSLAKDQGSSNHTFRLDAEHESWALRIHRALSPLGVDRIRELRTHSFAADYGLAPEIIYSGAEFLLTRWLGEEARGSIEKKPQLLTSFLRRLHSLPIAESETKDALEVSSRLAQFRRLLPECSLAKARLVEHNDCLERATTEVRQTSEQTPARLSLCHNDLNPSNLRIVNESLLHVNEPNGRHAKNSAKDRAAKAGPRVVALDWEYASLGHPFHDLAVALLPFSPKSKAQLLGDYLGHPANRTELAQFTSFLLVARALEVSWYQLYATERELQSSIQQFDDAVHVWVDHR
ncbi:MAG: phosphotransferase [Pseudomonadota bacterium]